MSTHWITCAPVLALVATLSWTGAVESSSSYDFTLIADTSGSISGFNSNIFPSINAGGVVAFEGLLRTGVEGIFTGNGGTLTTIATNAPTSPIAQFGPGFFAGPSINADGTVAFSAVLKGEGFGIFSSNGGALTPIADTGGLFSSLQGTAINNHGVVAFGADLRTGGSIILTGTGGPLATIAEVSSLFGGTSINDRGTVAFTTNPITPSAGIFAGNGGPLTTIVALDKSPFSQATSQSINNSGSVAFGASLKAGGGGIFTGAGGPITRIADSSGPFSFFFAPSINDEGTVAFLAGLDAGGAGIFIGPDVEADKVIATGDRLFGSTVTFFEFGGGQSLNNTGQIAFRAGLSDGRFVIVRADPVPEPSSLILSALSAIGLLSYNWRVVARRAIRFYPDSRRRHRCFRGAGYPRRGGRF